MCMCVRAYVSHSLFFTNISRTVVGPLAGERVRMGLYTVRIKDLHNPTKVDALYEVVDIRVPDIVAEDEESLLDVLRLSQRHNQVSQISEPRVHLDNYDRSVAGQRPERLFVVHFLFCIRPLDLTADFRNLEFRKRAGAPVRQAGGRITALLQESENVGWRSHVTLYYGGR